ncbi:hypothetical protein MU848_06800 [Sphingobium sp. MAH-33]|uniref:Uncharacterized protein n=1 Tax=Sphingobium agri TaxID=2933566 RepID=A0ABT0DW02_9SPHN|nr:hypothetical protein [Sphingobium agri]MCK0531290.1 hypothetical protein [Sphingobium agri]
MFRHRSHHDIVERLHADAAASALRETSLGALVTCVVAVTSALTSFGRHAAAAPIAVTAADHRSGQQVRPGLYRRSAHSRVAPRHLSTGGIKEILRYQGRNGNRDPFLLGAGLARTGVTLVIHDEADIGAVAQDGVDIGCVEGFAADLVAALVEDLRKPRYPNGRALIAIHISFKDEDRHVHRQGIMLELLPVLPLRLFHGDGLESERRPLPVPEPPRSVREHGALHMLRILS